MVAPAIFSACRIVPVFRVAIQAQALETGTRHRHSKQDQDRFPGTDSARAIPREPLDLWSILMPENGFPLADDLLVGVPAIAEYLGAEERRVRWWVERRYIPVFKIGALIAARRSELDEALRNAGPA